jgi:hypothetical protein
VGASENDAGPRTRPSYPASSTERKKRGLPLALLLSLTAFPLAAQDRTAELTMKVCF